MEEKLDKIYKIVIVTLVLVGIMFVITIGGLFTTKSNTSENSGNNESNSETNNEYDVSSFDTLTLKQVLKLFDNDNKTYVVYFGRSTCSACVSFLPTLKTMQEKYNYTTKYMDITEADSESDDFEKLMKKLSKKVTLNVSGEEKTQEFGDFYGYTPMTFIISKGKFVDGIIGAYSESKFESFLNKNGIKKNN